MLKRKDDDAFDRLSNRYTIGMLVTMSLFIATKTYVGDPIDCFTPQEFHDNWVAYTDNYCWIKNTYYVPLDNSLIGPDGLPTPDHSAGEELPYYQWVPIILAFMIAMFAIPVYFWEFAMWKSGYDIESIIKVASKADNINPEERDETNKYLVAQLYRHITFHRNQEQTLGKLPLGNKYGRFLFIMYIITKCLYIAIPLILLNILKTMMGAGFSDYGVRALNGLVMDDGSYIANPMFPRLTMCDFAVRRLGGNIQRYSVQCLLSVNLFNEKVFLVLWWWLWFLAIISIVGLLIWLVRTLRPNSAFGFCSKYLRLLNVVNMSSHSDEQDVRTFVGDYLGLDGVFCMRLLAKNTADVTAAEIITELFKKWRVGRGDKSSLSESKPMLAEDNV